MANNLPTKELIIAIVEKEGSILMRKKPEGSLPYKETWYLFGCERLSTQEDSVTIQNYLKIELDINVEVNNRIIPSGFEIKKDHDGVEKNFIYSNLLCKYLNGTPQTPSGIERVEWLPKNKLSEYDLVPPSVKLLKSLGYL